MNNLLNPCIECTDPSTLQYCLRLSDKEFWYCQPNDCHDNLFPEVDTIERFFCDFFTTSPKALISLSSTVTEIHDFVSNSNFWYSGNIDVDDFTIDKQLELLNDYGYSWDDFDDDAQRNQIICENYFETYITDYI